VSGLEVDYCDRCGGLWFDERELSRLLATAPDELQRLRSKESTTVSRTAAARCPRDATALVRVLSASDRRVVVDRCPQCRGIWLDGGELASLLRARQG
jgi:Zn-finger nucleic acid-binding protein